jgi:hypothetical protein
MTLTQLSAGPTSILTVADDLLKNDGRKFLEMMEQLVRTSLLGFFFWERFLVLRMCFGEICVGLRFWEAPS